MKAKMTVYKGGGKAPASGMGKKVVKYQMGGKPPIKPPVKVAGATVVTPKGGGVKSQTFGTKDYTQRRDDLMAISVAKFMEGKPSGYKITESQRRVMQDEAREKLTKGGQRSVAPVFKDTGVKLTPAQIAERNRIMKARK
jgi:hypothetical protein